LIFPPVGFSLRWYVNYATTTAWRLATLNSVLTATGSMVLATVLGTLAALAIARGRLPFRGGITTLFLFPMIVPSIVTAVAIYNTFARLGLTDSVVGMILAHTDPRPPLRRDQRACRVAENGLAHRRRGPQLRRDARRARCSWSRCPRSCPACSPVRCSRS
jgi:ABC-type sugar transport system permease subunit